MAPTPPYPSTRPRPLSLPTARRPRVVLHMRSASHLAGKSPTVTIEDGEVDADVDEMKHSMALLMREAENQATASRDSSHYTLASSMNTLLDSTPPPAHSEKHSESTRLTSLERKYLCHRLPVLDRRVLRTFGVYMGQWKNVAWPSEPWHCDLLVMPLREAWEWAEFAKSGTVLPFSVLEEDIKRNTAAMKTEVKAVGKSGVRGQDENGTSPSLGASGKQINGDAEDNSATSESDNESDAGSSHIGESQGGFAMVRRAISRMSSKKVAGQGDPTSEDRDPKTGALGAIMRVLSKKQTSDSHRKKHQTTDTPVDCTDQVEESTVTDAININAPAISPPFTSIAPSSISPQSAKLSPSADSILPSDSSGSPLPTSPTGHIPLKILCASVEVSALEAPKRLSSFLSQIQSYRDNVPPPTQAGILLRGCLSDPKRVQLVSKIVSRIGKRSCFLTPVLIEADLDGATDTERIQRASLLLKIFEACRDELSGVVLVGGGVVEVKDGCPKQRIRLDSEKNVFDSVVRLMSDECGIRDSFVVTDVTLLHGAKLPPALERHRVAWAKERGFLSWSAQDSSFTSMEDLPQSACEFRNVDVFEWGIGDPEVIAIKARVESTWREIIGKSGWEVARDSAVATAREWQPPFAEFELAVEHFRNGGVDEARRSIRVSPTLPPGPTVSDLTFLAADLERHPPNFASHGVLNQLRSLHENCTSGRGECNVVECSFIGQVPCPQRRSEVTHRIYAAMGELRIKGLLASFKDDNDIPEGFQSAKPANAYCRFLTILNRMASTEASGALCLTKELPRIAAELANDLEKDSIRVFLASKASFRLHGRSEGSILPYAPVWGVGASDPDSNGTTFLYICDSHPQPEEVIFNLYLQLHCKVDPEVALIGELLVASHGAEHDITLRMPSRLEPEVDISDRDDLGTLVLLRTSRKEQVVARAGNAIDTLSIAGVFLVHDHISELAHFELLAKEKGKKIESAVENCRPDGAFESCLFECLGTLLVSQDPRSTFSSLVKHLGALLDSPKTCSFACLFFGSLWKGFQHLVFEELKISLRAKNGFRFLPEPDQVAVALEMLSTQRNLATVFGCSSRQLSVPFLQHLRHEAQLEGNLRHFSVDSKSADLAEELSFSFLHEQARDFVNAFIFVYPVLLDILISSVLGPGIFLSNRIGAQMQSHVSTALIISFPVVGGLLNCIARSSTTFINAKSYPVFFELLLNKFAMALQFSSIVSVLVGLVFSAVCGVQDILLFPYMFFFIWFMILLGTLLLLRDTKRFFLASDGPQGVALATLTLLVAPLSTFYGFSFASEMSLMLVYIVVFTVADAIMLYQLTRMARNLLELPQSIVIPNQAQVVALFERKCPQPELRGRETPTDFQKRLRLWERTARQSYIKEMERVLPPRPFSLGGKADMDQSMLFDRRQQWSREKEVVTWFSETSGVGLPQRFSQDWDSMVRQAITKLKGRYQATRPNRGDVLFDMEFPAIVFGVVYFVFIFCDRWATLLFQGTTYFLFPIKLSDSVYTVDESQATGVRFGTLFILIGSGLLEISLLRILKQDQEGKSTRLSKQFTPEKLLIIAHQATKVIFWKELVLFCVALLLTLGFVAVFGMNVLFSNSSTLLSFAVETFGFWGLLIGLFAKLYVKEEMDLNFAMAISCFVGIAGSFISLVAFGSPRYVLLICATSSWLFAFGAFVIGGRDNVFRQRGFRLSPLLNTSGFHRLGKFSDTISSTQRNEMIRLLRKKRSEFQKLPSPTADMAFRILSGFLSRIKQTTTEDAYVQRCETYVSIATMAFPDLARMVSLALEEYRADNIVVYALPEYLSKLLKQQYFAVASKSEEDNKLEIFCAMPEMDPKYLQPFVMEVVLHEYLEAIAGFTHSETIAATHYILCEDSSHLTLATKIDLEERERDELQVLHLNAEREFVARYRRCLDIMDPDFDLHSMLGKLPSTSSSLRSLLSAQFALIVGTSAKAMQKKATNKEKDRKSSDVAPTIIVPHSGQSFRGMLLLLYLALTTDARFGREVSTLSVWLRGPLGLIYRTSLHISLFLKKWLVYQKLVHVQTFLRRSNGLRRTYYTDSPNYRFTGKESIVRCDLFDWKNKTTVSIKTMSDLSSLPICMFRYNGPKKADWTPVPSADKHISKSYFSDERLRLEVFCEREAFTAVYDYGQGKQIFPQRRVILRGQPDERWLQNIPNLEAEDSWIETHHFHGTTGQVYKSIFRTSRMDQSPVSATYSYLDDNQFSTAETAHYFVAAGDWSLTARFARGWTHDSTFPKFSLIEYRVGDLNFRVTFDYSHPQHTKFDCVQVLETGTRRPTIPPEFITSDPLGLLKRQPPICFWASNELHSTHLKAVPRRQWFRVTKIDYYGHSCSTPRIREELWAAWRAQKLPGAIARTLDMDVILRADAHLKDYFRQRDSGNRAGALNSLQGQRLPLEHLLVVPDTPETRPSSMHVRLADLEDLASGGDSSLVSSRSMPNSEAMKRVAIDSGTFPTGGGGVGSCRRDLVNNLDRVRWDCLAELADAEVAQREYQLEKNIDSIHYLPIWDLDFGTANENFRRQVSAVELERRRLKTTKSVVKTKFTPLVTELVNGIFDNDLAASKVDFYEDTFVKMYEYFGDHDWSLSWESKEMIDVFTSGVLQLCASSSSCFEGTLPTEMPTLSEIAMLYTLLSRTLLPLSHQLPDFCDNRVCFHASHHGPQAIIGVVAKKLHGVTLVLWDHGILWRERLYGLCDAQTMTPFVQMGFAGITRLIAWLVVRRADAITPCTSIQNPDWEAHLGGGKFGDEISEKDTRLKISPVVNGMSVARFQPNVAAELEKPTAIMLSHVSPVKGVAGAIAAAGVIVNELGFRNFELHIYGSTEKDSAYTAACTSLISSLNLTNHVFLKGVASPASVLPQGWVFVNSSITEGLPLALGEAGLCGLPVVCTDVGGSREVVSDLRSGTVYGAIVPPGQAQQLARAILSVLAVADGLDAVAGESFVAPVKLVDYLSRGESGVTELEARITDPRVKEARRRLGMLLRERTIRTFSLAKFLRVHEQVMYLGTAYSGYKANRV